jgi:uncharacterized linocin/CFP29 family protein
MEPTNEINWPETVWKEINDGIVKEASKVRIAQRVFPSMILENNPTQIPDEVIDFADLSIKEGTTKPLVEIHTEFPLTSTQVKQETDMKTCQTLARMAAKVIALAEDAYFFQLSDRDPHVRTPKDPDFKVRLPGNVIIDNWRNAQDIGLLAEANPPDADDKDVSKVSKPISVSKLPDGSLATWGENTFKAITAGITKLVAKGQAPPYALILPMEVYADAFVPPSAASLVTTADRIKPLVDGGFYSSGVLPDDEGLLVALAGEPVKLYVGREASAEFVRKEGAKYFFRVAERVQYVVRDPRALVLLKFAPKGEPR